MKIIIINEVIKFIKVLEKLCRYDLNDWYREYRDKGVVMILKFLSVKIGNNIK